MNRGRLRISRGWGCSPSVPFWVFGRLVRVGRRLDLPPHPFAPGVRVSYPDVRSRRIGTSLNVVSRCSFPPLGIFAALRDESGLRSMSDVGLAGMCLSGCKAVCCQASGVWRLSSVRSLLSGAPCLLSCGCDLRSSLSSLVSGKPFLLSSVAWRLSSTPCDISVVFCIFTTPFYILAPKSLCNR